MLKLSRALLLLALLLSPPAPADVQVSIGIGLPHVSIGINVPAYPRLVLIPGYPVYYAPSLRANFFFYDGMYWVYQDDYWYASYWYNGPWWIVEPVIVPVFILRVPVRYYSRPPSYFSGWRPDAPPHWGDRWGRDWEQRRSDWDRWDRRAAPPPAPPPDYQRQYSGDRYPQQIEQQYELHEKNYRYQPHDPVVREHYREQAEKVSPGRRGDEAGSRSQPPSREDRDVRKSPAAPQERQEAPDRRPSQQRDERDSDRQDMQQQRQQEPRSLPQQKEDRERKPPQGRQEAPDRKSPSQRESEPDQRGYAPEKRGSPDDRDAPRQDMQSSPRRQQEPRSQQPQRKDKKDDSRSVPGHSKDERSQYQNPEQAIAESGLYGFRSTARSRAIYKIQASAHILKINAGTRPNQED